MICSEELDLNLTEAAWVCPYNSIFLIVYIINYIISYSCYKNSILQAYPVIIT